MAFGVPYQQPGFAPGYYPMGQQMPAAMPDQLAQWRQAAYPQQQPTTQQTAQQPSPIIWVQNHQAAENYMVAPNSAVVLWDSNVPVIYLKQCDASGKPNLKIYDLIERTENNQSQKPDVNNDEINNIKNEITNIKAEIEKMQNEIISNNSSK